MKVRILVALEEIDNGWLDLARKASTCAVAQALVNAKIVRDKRARGVDVLNDTVLLRLPNDGDQSVFTVSLAFSEWIADFDRWTAVRNNYQKWRKQCADLRRLGKTDLPPMPATKGNPVSPVTVIIDTEERHISIEGEPESKSERVILPAHYVNQYSLAFRRNFGSVQQLDRQRFMSLYAYLQVLSDVQRSKSTSRIGHPPENKADEETVSSWYRITAATLAMSRHTLRKNTACQPSATKCQRTRMVQNAQNRRPFIRLNTRTPNSIVNRECDGKA